MSIQMQNWLSVYDQFEAFLVDPETRPHLEVFFNEYQWPAEVREADVSLFLVRWEEHWHQLCQQSSSSRAQGKHWP